MERTVGNVVQSIPFVEANQNNHGQFSLRKLLIHLVGASQSLSSLTENCSRFSYLLDKHGKFCRPKTEKHSEYRATK